MKKTLTVLLATVITHTISAAATDPSVQLFNFTAYALGATLTRSHSMARPYVFFEDRFLRSETQYLCCLADAGIAPALRDVEDTFDTLKTDSANDGQTHKIFSNLLSCVDNGLILCANGQRATMLLKGLASALYIIQRSPHVRAVSVEPHDKSSVSVTSWMQDPSYYGMLLLYNSQHTDATVTTMVADMIEQGNFSPKAIVTSVLRPDSSVDMAAIYIDYDLLEQTYKHVTVAADQEVSLKILTAPHVERREKCVLQ